MTTTHKNKISRLKETIADLRGENRRLRSGFRESSLVSKSLFKKSNRQVNLHVPLSMKEADIKDGGVLVVLNVGSSRYEPSKEDIDSCVSAVMASLEEALPKGRPFAVLGVRYDVKVDGKLLAPKRRG